jgi:hypothetical protein
MDEQKLPIQFARRFSSRPDYEKFNTCRHRSDLPETFTIQGCCQKRQKSGWVCHKLSIYGLTANHCTDCPVYEKKENG